MKIPFARHRTRLLAALAPLAAVIAAGATASGAAAVSTAVSSNWSGYVVSATDAATGTATSYASVSGTWTQPTADCSSSSGSASAFWVGLGGNSEVSQALEQAGTEVDCSANGTASYSAWYELVPAPSVKVSLKVGAGDRMYGSVKVNRTNVTVLLKNLTRGTSFTKTLTMAAPDLTSAEWIAEAPSTCTTYGRCRTVSLTNFRKVQFSGARATTSDGHTGAISDGLWDATAIQLYTQAGDPFSRFAQQVTAAKALPSTLSADGSSFLVAWSVDDSATAPGSVHPGFGFGQSPFGPGF